ncbi:hypothetical protein B484DRAFT_456373 [Ochromonadaceae sp. CCMP2298]|nr:hypothetical protein B484DRAFT_456373 [Ochromonadaceae sp. CCMP2298]
MRRRIRPVGAFSHYRRGCATRSMEGANLATVVRVLDLVPIAGKDQIELAVVKGWRCIVRKGEFSLGNLAIYFALDSVPDFEDPHFSFLRKFGRIKTLKMGGVVSQGLLGGLSWYAERGHGDTLAEHDDVTVAMGVSKYVHAEEAVQYRAQGVTYREFPHMVPKTDALRLQACPDALNAIAGRDVVITRKEDGCSCTCVALDGEFLLCGRNFVWDAEDGSVAHYFQMQAQYSLKHKLLSLGRNLAFQCEILGPKVNGNRLRLQHTTLAVFDVYDIDAARYLPYAQACALCLSLDLPQVPLIYRGPANNLFGGVLSVDGFLELAEGVEYVKGVRAEGVVVKTEGGEEAEFVGGVRVEGARVVFKVVSNKYLLKHDL